jgi:hypothetical protein
VRVTVVRGAARAGKVSSEAASAVTRMTTDGRRDTRGSFRDGSKVDASRY